MDYGEVTCPQCHSNDFEEIERSWDDDGSGIIDFTCNRCGCDFHGDFYITITEIAIDTYGEVGME